MQSFINPQSASQPCACPCDNQYSTIESTALKVQSSMKRSTCTHSQQHRARLQKGRRALRCNAGQWEAHGKPHAYPASGPTQSLSTSETQPEAGYPSQHEYASRIQPLRKQQPARPSQQLQNHPIPPHPAAGHHPGWWQGLSCPLGMRKCGKGASIDGHSQNSFSTHGTLSTSEAQQSLLECSMLQEPTQLNLMACGSCRPPGR